MELIKKKNKDKKFNIKGSFSNKRFKNGAYSIAITIIVIALVLLFNLIIGEFDLKIDLSSNAKYTLTDETRQLVDNINDDITLYYIAQDGAEDETIKNIIDKYSSLSSNIKVVQKDPILYPKFTSQYTDENVYENSVIIVNNTNDKSKYVPYSSMLELDYSSYYTTGSSTITGIDVEGQITSAIQYVTTQNLPKLYQVKGHGESELNNTLISLLEKSNIDIETIQTLSAEKIPDDCSVLLINGPIYDFTEDETNIIKDYLVNGGNAIIFTMYTQEDMKNFNSLLEYYGIMQEDGYVIEGNSNNYMSGNPIYLMPNINSHDITDNLNTIIVPLSKGLKISNSLRNTITITSILDTSDKSYSKVDMNSSTYKKENSDIEGGFSLGLLAEESYNGVDTKLMVYGSSLILDEQMTSISQLGNINILSNTINYMSNIQENLSIPVRSLEQKYLTLTSSQVKFWAIIVIGIIPLSILFSGIYVVVNRRRK